MKLGIIGGGQLGRLLAHAAHELGIEPIVLCPDKNCSAASFSNVIEASYEDAAAIMEMAKTCDAVTYEFENIPASIIEQLSATTRALPPSKALRVSQDRLLEKTFLSDLNIPVAKFAPVHQDTDPAELSALIGFPLILKTTTMGYDGKGQARASDLVELRQAIHTLGRENLVAEEFVDFSRELSIIAVRNSEGDVRCYPLAQNEHRSGILVMSAVDPALISPELQRRANSMVRTLMEALNYVGVFALELFETPQGLIANEFAPRVHNSGHWSIEGAYCSQFENHVRAVCSLPLGSTEMIAPTVMLNLIGEIPDKTSLLSTPKSHLHDYEKTPRPGRKVGHLTLSATTVDEIPPHLYQMLPR